MDQTAIIGIDLGTTNTCAAAYKGDRIVVITNDHGLRTTPSVVSFAASGTQIGQIAKDTAYKHPENTVYDIKRIIGRNFDDDITQQEIRNWPFRVIDSHSNPKICVRDNGEDKEFHPEEISAMILRYMKELAERFLGGPVTRAVITVPAYFNHSQRRATKDAGHLAGLKVIRMINEPTAAALAYGHENISDTPRTVLVYDLGGGTFDVSVVRMEGYDYEVVATSGDTHLGGVDFDTRLVEYFLTEFRDKHSKCLRDNPQSLRRLRSKCETAKERLSFMNSTDLELDSLFENQDYYTSITRIKFEQLNIDLFERTIDIVRTCLQDANITKEEITDVVLVGGSTRIPKIEALVSEFFDDMPLRKNVNPDEAVAYGAAIQASILDGSKSESAIDITVKDVISLSLGEMTVAGEFCVMIPRNTPIPHRRTETFFTAFDNQTASFVEIYQGENMLAKDNHFLGRFTIFGIPPRPKGQVKFVDTFYVDHDGILHVDSVHEETGLRGDIRISLEENRLPKNEIDRLVQEAERRRQRDAKADEMERTLYQIESYCATVVGRLEKIGDGMTDQERQEIRDICDRGLAEAKQLTEVEELRRMLLRIKTRCKSCE